MSKNKRILIVGAGVAGKDILSDIKKHRDLKIDVIGFIDDDVHKKNKLVGGVKILGSISDIDKIITREQINEIIIAIPSAEGESIEKLVKIASECGVSYKIVPRVKEIIEGKASYFRIRKVDVQDLLGRPVIKDDVRGLKHFFKNKCALITGAAGSIGSELSVQIASYRPKKIILFDVWENGIFELIQKLTELGFTRNIEYRIGNIQDLTRLEEVFASFKPDFVFHAAAYKHVPLMEENPYEAIKNNVIGTFNVASTSVRYHVKKFVLISTDKAANPKNIMGFTKQIAERVVRSMAGKTKFSIVRFGNVLDSNGSVVPIFRKQIEKGGPITVTNKKMTRYFMTIPEACGLILKSALMSMGDELFVLDMGKPILILNLAYKMIGLAGLIPNEDIQIRYTGIRKGEKLHERLFASDEKLFKTTDKKIFTIKGGKKIDKLDEFIEKMNRVIQEKKKFSKSSFVRTINENK